MATPTITLKPSGQKVAQVGFGLWKVGRNPVGSILQSLNNAQVPNDSTADVVYGAIKNGYRHFDGACDYGTFVGELLFFVFVFDLPFNRKREGSWRGYQPSHQGRLGKERRSIRYHKTLGNVPFSVSEKKVRHAIGRRIKD